MYYFFVNPAAKSGHGVNTWQEVKSILDSRNVEYEVVFTQKDTSVKSEYEAILERHKGGPIKLVVLGGDGTLNQCIEGVTDLEGTELSLIRSGSGNDFAHDKDLPLDIKEQVEGILESRHSMDIDVCEVYYSDGDAPDGHHRFLVSAGFGYDADICFNANKSKLKKWLGRSIYIFYGIKDVFTTALADIEVYTGGEKRNFNRLYFIAAMNQSVEGGGIPMCPDANDTDGKLGFCLIHSLSRIGALMLVPKLQKKKHVGKRGVDILEAKELTVHSSEPKMVHYDGETPGMYRHFRTKVIGKIKFIY